jgi:cellulose synthase/poly-beta-1,6-N-acetylglucosamine synthase-like glycosyltransferase
VIIILLRKTNENHTPPSEGNLLTGNPPKVSVIMSGRNEAGYIERSLGVVPKQGYRVDLLEAIVADGKSENGTRELILRLIVTGVDH